MKYKYKKAALPGKKRWWPKLLLAGIVFYIVGLIAYFPANLAWQLFGDEARQQNITLQGISGSVWNGKAKLITTPKISLFDSSWSLRFMDLLSLGLGADLQTDLGAGSLQASVTAYSETDFNLHSVKGLIPAKTLLDLTQYKGWVNTGLINVDIADVEIENLIPTSAKGEIVAQDLSLALMVPPAPLGDYIAEFIPSERNTDNNDKGAIDIMAVDAPPLAGQSAMPFELMLEIELDDVGCYLSDGYIMPRDTADPRLLNMLAQQSGSRSGLQPGALKKIPLKQKGCLTSDQSTRSSSGQASGQSAAK